MNSRDIFINNLKAIMKEEKFQEDNLLRFKHSLHYSN
jgi:hypothetical protein